MSSRAPLSPRRPQPGGEQLLDSAPQRILRRREASFRVGRRRRLVADLLLAVVVAVIAIVVAPGLAVVAIVAALTLLACGAWLMLGRVRRRRA